MPRFLTLEEREELEREDDGAAPLELGSTAAQSSPGFLPEDVRAELEAPDEPQAAGPAFDTAGRVYVENQFGRIGTVDPGEAGALGEGMRLASRERVARELQRAENESAVGMLQTAGEQGLQGLTLGGYGAVAEAVSPEYRQRMEARAEDNPGTALAGNLVGSVAPVLLSGGAGALARGAALTPTALAARAALATTEATAARLGGGVMGRVGATALGGAVEGAIAGAAAQVADAVPQFTTDPTEAAEHILYGAGEGALLGMALGGGLGAVGEAGRGAARLGSGLLPQTGTLRDMAGESAFKAVVGRTNKASQKFAMRHGGDAAVGNTLLKEGIPLHHSPEAILEATSKRADEIGAELGAKAREIDQMGGIPISGREILQRIDSEVVQPLRDNIFADDITAAVEGKLARFSQAMGGDAPLSFDDVRKMRMDLDATLLKWESAGPPTPTTQALRDVRTELEHAWLDAAERSAASVGAPGYADQVRALKTKYAHMRLAADQAEENVLTRKANRFISLSDNLWGAGALGGAALGDPAGIALGAATSLAHKYVRERGRGLAALALHQMASMAEQKTAMVALAQSGQQRVTRAAQQLVNNTGSAKYALGGQAIASRFTDDDFHQAVAEANELGDPNSDASRQMVENARQLDMINPGMGMAYAETARARAQLISGVMPKRPSTAIFSPGPVADPVTERKARRLVEASYQPQRALARVAAGSNSPEDVLALQQVYPALYKRFQRDVQREFGRLKQPPNLETRLRIAYATGLATDPTMVTGELGFLQSVATQPDQQRQAEQQDAQRDQSVAQQFKPRDVDQTYAPRTDDILNRR